MTLSIKYFSVSQKFGETSNVGLMTLPIGKTISFAKQRKYGENTVVLAAGVARYAIIIPGRYFSQSSWFLLTKVYKDFHKKRLNLSDLALLLGW